LINISRQAVDQYYKKALQNSLKATQFIEKAKVLRRDHPGQGCRKMALNTREYGWGRDKVEQLLLAEGFRIVYAPNYIKTTYPQYDLIFPNLIEGVKLSGINQLIQTDITYIWIKGRFYYLVLIIDVYSRRIVGYNISENMLAECNLKALKMMIKLRKGDSLKEMIHHSDRGSQYTSKAYLALLKKQEMKISMCKHGWENAYAERINRTIKEEYLNEMKIFTSQQLKSTVKRVIGNYNLKRMHSKLYGHMSPVEFEKYVNKLPVDKRPTMQLYQPSNKLSTIGM
jgi:transposase InsO family protein